MGVEAVGHRRDLGRHRQVFAPFGRDCFDPKVRSGDLSVDCAGGVGIVSEVDGQEGAFTKVPGPVEGPKGCLQ